MISPLGQSVRVNKIYWRVLLEIQGVMFSANLMELSFGEFGFILGMDCFVEHRVNLDYASKRVILRSNNDVEIVMVGEYRDYLSNVIFALVIERLVQKGCEAYLTFVFNLNSTKPFLNDIQIVRDFSDVFPKELLRLPPNKEVEFGIELLPSTAPVFIAPYCMAPKELIELKA